MDAFYAALKTRHTLGRPVRVAYFGDSFIEGDLITDHLRRLMQDKWGGCGVGFVDIASEFMKKVSEMPEVTECYNVSGQYDYVLKVHVNDMRAYQQFVINKLGTIDHLSHIESVFVMDEVKQDYGLNF